MYWEAGKVARWLRDAGLEKLRASSWREVAVLCPRTRWLAPIRAALWRTAFLLLGGGLFAAGLAYLLAHRLIVPIRQLEDGARRIGAGQFDHQIRIATGDESKTGQTRQLKQ